jgi:hypothetical protein
VRFGQQLKLVHAMPDDDDDDARMEALDAIPARKGKLADATWGRLDAGPFVCNDFVMSTERVEALVHAHNEALAAYVRAKVASKQGLPSTADVQRVDDARVLLEVATRAYFETAR